MFSGVESIKQLQQSARSSRYDAPPSHQPAHRRAPSHAPSDYPGDNTRNLLLSAEALPPSSELPRLGTKRQRVEESDDEDEDEDDNGEFETDRRPVDATRRSNINASIARKRTAVPSSMPAPPARSPSSTQPMAASSQDVFAAIKYKKATITAQARAAAHQRSAPPSSPQSSLASSMYSRMRVPWSEEDTNVLLQLVRECGAKWSLMDKEPYASRFIERRNQQAYRDKARNMKVDFLITDAVLPAGFDLVYLSKKERERLTGLGKNPDRRQADVGEDGRATNTEWTGY